MVTVKTPKTVQHGERGCYTNHRCRRPECKKAHSDYLKVMREKRKREGLPVGDRRHGSDNGYVNYGCRCQPCSQAHSEVYYHSVGKPFPVCGDNDILLEDLTGTPGTLRAV